MTQKERTPYPTEGLSLQEAATHIHTFVGQDEFGNPTQEQYMVMGQEAAEYLTHRLAEHIEVSGFKPDIVIPVVRGGMPVARLLADYLGNLPCIAITIASNYSSNGREPPIVLHGLPDKSEFETGLRKLKKFKEGQTIQRVLLAESVADDGSTGDLAFKEVEEKWGVTRESGNLKFASLLVKSKALSQIHVDYYEGCHDLWIIFPWERKESFVTLFRKWKSYKEPLSDDKIKYRFRELGYKENDIAWFGKELFNKV